MRPVKRIAINKRASARTFRKHSARTKAANMQPTPMRGGFRL